MFAGDGDIEDYDYNVEGGQNRLDVQVSISYIVSMIQKNDCITLNNPAFRYQRHNFVRRMCNLNFRSLRTVVPELFFSRAP